jgi:hypothetical protein
MYPSSGNDTGPITTASETFDICSGLTLLLSREDFIAIHFMLTMSSLYDVSSLRKLYLRI